MEGCLLSLTDTADALHANGEKKKTNTQPFVGFYTKKQAYHVFQQDYTSHFHSYIASSMQQ